MTPQDSLQSAMAAIVLALVAIVTGVFFSNKAIVIIAALGACCCAFAPVIRFFQVHDQKCVVYGENVDTGRR